jgi:hypothetical protein
MRVHPRLRKDERVTQTTEALALPAALSEHQEDAALRPSAAAALDHVRDRILRTKDFETSRLHTSVERRALPNDRDRLLFTKVGEATEWVVYDHAYLPGTNVSDECLSIHGALLLRQPKVPDTLTVVNYAER